MPGFMTRFDRLRAELQSWLPYPAQQQQTAFLWFIWMGLLVAMGIQSTLMYPHSVAGSVVFWLVWTVLLPADLWLPSRKAPLWLRLSYLIAELTLTLVLCWLGGFEVGSYLLFAVVAHGFILGDAAAFAFLPGAFLARFETMAASPRDASTPLTVHISWAIGATFVVAATTAMFKALEQRQQIEQLAENLKAVNRVAQEQARELERQALEDALTGLHNRRFMEMDLPREFERQRRFGRPFTLALVDIDDFKAINDGYSHQTGDAVLAELARIFKSLCRTVDGVVRYGGDEFTLYFPETSLADGQAICNRVRQATVGHDWGRIAAGLQVSLSIGLSASTATGSLDQLLAAADASLQAAKRAGKNQVRAA